MRTPRARAGDVGIVVATQAALHAPFGGVVSELASRHHLENICPVISKAMSDAGVPYPELDLAEDNAAMIGAAGFVNFQKGLRAGLDLNAEPHLDLA